jgi:hypothetical protein
MISEKTADFVTMSRLRRARRLARAVIEGHFNGDLSRVEMVHHARDLEDPLYREFWAAMTLRARLDRPPSQVTVDMTIELLEFAEEVERGRADG